MDRLVLRHAVERCWRKRTGAAARITSLILDTDTSSRRRGGGCFRAKFDSGIAWRIYVKDFSSGRDPPATRRRRFSRELGLYREFLGGARLGTPEFYGAEVDEAVPRYWLILEPVEGRLLAQGRPADWLSAARWLARLQSAFDQHRARALTAPALPVQTVDRLVRDWETACEAVARQAAGEARSIARMGAGYHALAAELLSGPAWLVHTSFNPRSHALLTDTGPSPRLCVVDWEDAALGCPVYDLAELALGTDSAMAGPLWTAYADEATRCGLGLPGHAERLYQLCQLHQALRMLRRAARYRGTKELIAQRLAMVATMWKQVHRV